MIDLAAIEDRAERATPAPWRTDGPDYHFYGDEDYDFVNTSLVTDAERNGIVAAVPPIIAVPFVSDSEARKRTEAKQFAYLEWYPQAEVDLEFVAHAREDVPALIQEVRRLREQVSALGLRLGNGNVAVQNGERND